MAYAKSGYDQHHRSAVQYPDASQNASHRGGHEFMAHGGGGNHLTNYPEDEHRREPGGRRTGKQEPRPERPLRPASQQDPAGGGNSPPKKFGKPGGRGNQGYSGYVSNQLIDEEPGRHEHPRHVDPDYHQWRSEQIRTLDRDYDEYRRERYRKFAGDFEAWRSKRTRNDPDDAGTGEASGKSADSLVGASTLGLK